MADPQLGLLPLGVMLPNKRREGPRLCTTQQDPFEHGGSSQRPSVEYLKDYSWHKLLSNRAVAQDNVYTHLTRNDGSLRIRHCSHPHVAGISQEDSGNNLQGQVKDLLYSSGHHPFYPKANNQDFISFTRKRVGVDRAYPLKPMYHWKSHGTGEMYNLRDKNDSLRSLEPRRFSYSKVSLPDQVTSPVFDPVLVESILANHQRADRVQIQRLEAVGASLQEEIRKKENLLKEKLKKTVEELRRIQKEREQTKENEKREKQRMTLPKRTVKSNRTTLRRPVFTPVSGPEEMSSRYRREDESWQPSRENSSAFQFSDDELQRLKRDRLVANNYKIQDHVSGPLMDAMYSQSSETSGGARQGSCSNSSPSRASDFSSLGCSTEEPELGECSHCRRRFLLSRLERHSNICSRMQASKRKVFDSSRARAKGTELEQYLNWKGTEAFIKVTSAA